MGDSSQLSSGQWIFIHLLYSGFGPLFVRLLIHMVLLTIFIMSVFLGHIHVGYSFISVTSGIISFLMFVDFFLVFLLFQVYMEEINRQHRGRSYREKINSLYDTSHLSWTHSNYKLNHNLGVISEA